MTFTMTGRPDASVLKSLVLAFVCVHDHGQFLLSPVESLGTGTLSVTDVVKVGGLSVVEFTRTSLEDRVRDPEAGGIECDEDNGQMVTQCIAERMEEVVGCATQRQTGTQARSTVVSGHPSDVVMQINLLLRR